MSLQRVLIANRGEIAVRVIRACHALGIEAYIAVSSADRDSLGAKLADRAVCIGPARASDSYLNENAVLETAKALRVDAIHPGYGFLSERPSFVEACERNGIGFVGPSAKNVRMMGNKLDARELAASLGVPIVPGSPRVDSYETAKSVVESIGLPVLFKAAAGGGGRGIRIVRELGELRPTFESATAEADAAFSDGTLYLERYVGNGRHIEVQVFGDRSGNVLHFGARDCSIQRRYQKIVEEAPAPFVPDDTNAALIEAALALTRGISYEGAGTVEFIYDGGRDEFYFLEMNTRIQVEHPVSEEVTGADLVKMQLEVAGGALLACSQEEISLRGHAIELRVNAESPAEGFRPSPGRVTRFDAPGGPGVRIDTHCYSGYLVPPFYDSLLAKLIVYGETRAEAITRAKVALDEFEIEGVETNLELLSFLVSHPDYQTGRLRTSWVEEIIGDFVPTRHR